MNNSKKTESSKPILVKNVRDVDPREYGKLSNSAKGRTAAIYIILMLTIAMNVVAIGLTGSANVRDNELNDVIGGGRGLAFSDDCWSCKQTQVNSSIYEVVINARMESKTQSGDSVKTIFETNGFMIGEQFRQQMDVSGSLRDPVFIGNSIVQHGVQWESRPGKQGFVYNKGIDAFKVPPNNAAIESQNNPGRKYCASMSENLVNDDEVYMFLDFQRSYGTSSSQRADGYWPEKSLNVTAYKCANYLGAIKMFYCAPASLATHLGCTTTDIDSTCDRSFETTWIGLDAPSFNYA